MRALLDSIACQTKRPDEVVIADAGSADGTMSIIRSFTGQTDIPVKLLVEPDANIAQGRNLAIAHSVCDIIAVTDGSCILDKDWLERITKPLERNIDVVFGSSIAIGISLVGRCFAKLYEAKTSQHKLSATEFSSRSVAFRKSAWQAVHGYPENLSLAGEDTLFFLRLMQEHNYLFERQAVVYWQHGYETLRKIFLMHFRNSIGSGESNMYFFRYLTLLALYLSAAFFLIIGFVWPKVYLPLLILSVLHLSRYTLGIYQRMRDLRVWLLMPILILIRESAMGFGYLSGLGRRIKG